ncbi:hypothetical protein GCM10027280_23450 [Micromonospora polyrhachis]
MNGAGPRAPVSVTTAPTNPEVLALIAAMPRVELCVHPEASTQPTTLLGIAGRNGLVGVAGLSVGPFDVT